MRDKEHHPSVRPICQSDRYFIDHDDTIISNKSRYYQDTHINKLKMIPRERERGKENTHFCYIIKAIIAKQLIISNFRLNLMFIN